jgi:nitrogen regulatory protein PII
MFTKYDNCLSPIFDLKDMLHNSGYHGITTKESTGYGKQKSTMKQIYRGKVYEKRANAIKRVEN